MSAMFLTYILHILAYPTHEIQYISKHMFYHITLSFTANGILDACCILHFKYE